jgi:hypothetical protein
MGHARSANLGTTRSSDMGTKRSYGMAAHHTRLGAAAPPGTSRMGPVSYSTSPRLGRNPIASSAATPTPRLGELGSPRAGGAAGSASFVRSIAA